MCSVIVSSVATSSLDRLAARSPTQLRIFSAHLLCDCLVPASRVGAQVERRQVRAYPGGLWLAHAIVTRVPQAEPEWADVGHYKGYFSRRLDLR